MVLLSNGKIKFNQGKHYIDGGWVQPVEYTSVREAWRFWRAINIRKPTYSCQTFLSEPTGCSQKTLGKFPCDDEARKNSNHHEEATEHYQDPLSSSPLMEQVSFWDRKDKKHSFLICWKPIAVLGINEKKSSTSAGEAEIQTGLQISEKDTSEIKEHGSCLRLRFNTITENAPFPSARLTGFK